MPISTMAYQGYGEGVDLAVLRRIISIATGGLQPDRTILLDLPAEAGLRRKTPDTITRFETSFDVPYHLRVRAGFLEMAAAEPARWAVIDADRGTDEVFDVAAIVMLIVAILLYLANSAIVKQADESTNEKLPFELQMTGLAVIFLIMTTLRIWFDLAEVDTVLDDQRAVRKSIAAAFRHTFRSLARLLTSYLAVTIVAAIVLVGGLWIWMKFVSPESVIGAFVIAQIMLFLLLLPRFWQRAIAVSYWQRQMLVPVVAVQPVEPAPLPVATAPIASVPEPAPVVSSPSIPPTETPQS